MLVASSVLEIIFLQDKYGRRNREFEQPVREPISTNHWFDAHISLIFHATMSLWAARYLNSMTSRAYNLKQCIGAPEFPQLSTTFRLFLIHISLIFRATMSLWAAGYLNSITSRANDSKQCILRSPGIPAALDNISAVSSKSCNLPNSLYWINVGLVHFLKIAI